MKNVYFISICMQKFGFLKRNEKLRRATGSNMENDNRRRREGDSDPKVKEEGFKQKIEHTESSINTEISIPANDLQLHHNFHHKELREINGINDIIPEGAETEEDFHHTELPVVDKISVFHREFGADGTLISRIKGAISSDDPQKQLEGCRLILDISDGVENHLPTPIALFCLFDSVIEANLVHKLIAMLCSSDHPALQENAAWILASIAKYQGKLLITEGAMKPLMSLMTSNNPRISRPACYALSGIANGGLCNTDKSDNYMKSNIEKFIKAEIVPKTIEFLTPIMIESEPNIPLLTAITTLIKSLCYVPKNTKIPKEMLSFLEPLLEVVLLTGDQDLQLLDQACWALYFLTKSGRESIIEIVVLAGILPKLVRQLESGNINGNVIVPCIKVLGNVVSSSIDLHTERVLNEGILPHLVNLISNPDFSVEVNWIVGNIAAGTIGQKIRIFESGLLQLTLETLKSEGSAATKLEAMHTILNFVEGGTAEHRRFLVAQGMFQNFAGVLREYPQELSRLVVDCGQSMLEMYTSDGDEQKAEIIEIFQDSGFLLAISKFQVGYEDAMTDKVAAIMDVGLNNEWF